MKYIAIILVNLFVSLAFARPSDSAFYKVIEFQKSGKLSSEIYAKKTDLLYFTFMKCSASEESETCEILNEEPLHWLKLWDGMEEVQLLNYRDIPVVSTIGDFNKTLPQTRYFVTKHWFEFMRVLNNPDQNKPVTYTELSSHANMIIEQILYYSEQNTQAVDLEFLRCFI